MTQSAPNTHFLHTKSAILMLSRLSLSPKVHILFVHGTAAVEICLITEKMKSKRPGWSLIHWLMICPNAHLSTLFASFWICKICILNWNRWRSQYIMCLTGLLKRSNVCWDKDLWPLLETDPNIVPQSQFNLSPDWLTDWLWPATATLMLTVNFPSLPFV